MDAESSVVPTGIAASHYAAGGGWRKHDFVRAAQASANFSVRQRKPGFMLKSPMPVFLSVGRGKSMSSIPRADIERFGPAVNARLTPYCPRHAAGG